MAYLSPERKRELIENAAKIVAPGKGILAADESYVFFSSRGWGIRTRTGIEAGWNGDDAG